MNDIIREFLLETHENLGQLDLDLVTLEKDPGERETLARVFRTLHTVKGTAGFLGLPKLQSIAHAGENLLGKLRAGELALNPQIATILLGVVDSIRRVLAALEASQGSGEGSGDYTELVRTLERLTKGVAGNRPVDPATTADFPKPTFQPPSPPTPTTATRPEVTVVRSPEPLPTEQLTSQPASLSPTIVTKGEVSIAKSAEPLPAEPAETRAPAVADTSIRVDVGLLDKLMNLVGELVLTRNQLVQFGSRLEDQAFQGTIQKLNLLTSELQVGVMKTRMQPVSNVWGKFPRIVRDLALACGKQVRIDMEGQETELDKSIMEAIRDPLTHMVRNAVDHGIETPAERVSRGKPAEGRLLLHAFHEGGKVVIELTDDGGGINPLRIRDKAVQAGLVSSEDAARMSNGEIVDLVFLPGFSTTDRVTQFSGRGVGMDVVRTNVEKIGGAVDIESRLGHGTTVRMKIPLTLAIIPALTVTAGGDRYAIPQVSLLELVRLEREQVHSGIESVHGAPVYRHRGSLLPLVYLDRELQVESVRGEGDEINIVVLQADDRPFGLVVDRIHDTEEIVVKPLQKLLKGIGVFAGATIMGDGKVALILDVLALAQRARVVSGTRDRKLSEQQAIATVATGDRQTILVCAIRGGGRVAIPLALVARLEEFPRSAVERAGEQDMIQYRGEILPLVHLSRALRRKRDGSRPGRRRAKRTLHRRRNADSLHVVVCAGPNGQIGLVVDRILDIAEETIVTRSWKSRPGVLFTAAVQNRVTEFLDIDKIIRSQAGEVQRPS